MNPLRHLENRIRGWLPKKSQTPSRQLSASRKPPKARTQVWIVAFVLGCVGGLLGAFASGMGVYAAAGVYVSVIFIVSGLAIVAAAVIKTKQKERQQRSQQHERC
jgi:predicted lipid-binding transport protein (Tim44 family)